MSNLGDNSFLFSSRSLGGGRHGPWSSLGSLLGAEPLKKTGQDVIEGICVPRNYCCLNYTLEMKRPNRYKCIKTQGPSPFEVNHENQIGILVKVHFSL